MDRAKFNEKLSRLMEASGSHGDSDLARALGIKPQSVAASRKRQQIPPGWIEQVAEKFRVSADWLFFGTGSMRTKSLPEKAQVSPHSATARGPLALPVIGMGECGIEGMEGWDTRTVLAIHATPPTFHANMVVCIANGLSMVPAGVLPGNMLYCDNTLDPILNDVVYIEKNSKYNSIKLYIGDDDTFYIFQGWLDPNEDGVQKPFIMKENKKLIKNIAPVTCIRRRI